MPHSGHCARLRGQASQHTNRRGSAKRVPCRLIRRHGTHSKANSEMDVDFGRAAFGARPKLVISELAAIRVSWEVLVTPHAGRSALSEFVGLR